MLSRCHYGEFEEALEELYTALDNDLRTLSAIGIRTAFDVASELLGIEAETFKMKIDGLLTAGHIGADDGTRIAVLVDAGSASVHRGWKPSISDLDVLMDILEHFVQSAFVAPVLRRVLDEKAAKIKTIVPARVRVRKHMVLSSPKPKSGQETEKDVPDGSDVIRQTD